MSGRTRVKCMGYNITLFQNKRYTSYYYENYIVYTHHIGRKMAVHVTTFTNTDGPRTIGIYWIGMGHDGVKVKLLDRSRGNKARGVITTEPIEAEGCRSFGWITFGGLIRGVLFKQVGQESSVERFEVGWLGGGEGGLLGYNGDGHEPWQSEGRELHG